MKVILRPPLMHFNYVNPVSTLIYAQGSVERWPQEEV